MSEWLAEYVFDSRLFVLTPDKPGFDASRLAKIFSNAAVQLYMNHSKPSIVTWR